MLRILLRRLVIAVAVLGAAYFLLSAVAFVAFVTLVGGRGFDPPRPTRALAADDVDLIVMWEDGDCPYMRFTLASGQVVNIIASANGGPICEPGGPIRTGRFLTDDDLCCWSQDSGERFTDGPLVYIGHDAEGPWYAVARSLAPHCPYELHGGAYDDGQVIHFSTGLVVPKARSFDFEHESDRDDGFPLRDADTLCVNRKGEAILARIWRSY
jgi:hypothetical protein